jgi:tetratricopeptide (TPR) repeat protein
VRNVLSVSQDNRRAAAQHAIPLLEQSLQENPNKYQTHFNLAWLSLFFLKDYEHAEKHFSSAVAHSRKKNHLFSLFALRHLAKTHYMKGDYHEAESVMSEVLNNSLHPDPEYQYEYARYLAAKGEVKLSALYLEQAIEKLPIYYTQAAAEPDFGNKGIISQLLETYKQQSLNYVREQTKRTWNESELSSLKLPEDVSTARVLQDTCKKHEKEIEQHPLVIVKNTQKQIDEKLLKYSKEALLNELIDKEKYCLKKISYKRSHWKLINKSGGMLIHAASILLLATFFVLAAKYILVSVGLGTVFYFEEVTGLAFITVLSLGGIGFYLLQSQPFGVRKLFEKSTMFRDAMTVVHKM